MPAKFEIYKDRKKEFRFRLKATNGEIILTGEGYKTKTGVKNGISSIQKNSPNNDRFETRVGRNKKTHFVLKGGNGHVIGQSEQYESAQACKRGIASVSKNAPKAKVEDLT